MTARRAGRSRGRVTRVIDERGRRVAMVDPLVMRLAGDDRVDGPTLERVARRVGPGIDVWPRRALYVGLAGIGLAISIFAVRYGLVYARTGVVPAAHLLGRLPVLVAVGTGLGFHWIVARRVRMRRVRDAMLDEDRCPHCVYDLRAQASHEGHEMTCPECGCVWPIRRARGVP